MNSPWIRNTLLCGLVLLLAGMGPGALVRIPRALSPGSEEEVRHADSEVIGNHPSVKLRPARRRTAVDSRLANHANRSPSRTHTERKLAILVPRSLRALQIQIEV